MTPRRLRKAIVLAVGLLFVLVAALGAAGPARAAQNAPSWSTGDSWTWVNSAGSVTYTYIWTVREQTTLTLTSGTYTLWHVNASATATTNTSSATGWGDLWFQVGTLSQAKSVTGPFTYTYDPPQALAVFPLNQNSWSLTTTRTRTGPFGTSTTTVVYTGTALAEMPVTVPAGTFTTSPVQTPASGTNYQIAYYSDAVGSFVKVEHYQAGVLATSQTQVLTTYKYQSAAYWLFFIVIGAVLGALVLAAVVLYALRHRRPRYPTQYAQAQPVAPQGPPYQPPQQPPQGPPGM